MSISQSMQTGVSGLSAQAASVSKIASNISNTGTIGYKRTFVDMVTSTSGGNAAAGVKAVDGAEVSKAGITISTSSPFDYAVDGQGFFLVSKNPNDPVEANYFLSRAGNFSPDENGNLRNAAGYYLAAFPTDVDGNVGAVDYSSVTSVQTVNVTGSSVSAAASTEASLRGNLPAAETGTGEVTAPFESTMRYVNQLGGVERLRLSWQASDTTPNLWTATISGQDGTVFGTVETTFFDSGPSAGAPASFTGAADPGLAAPAAFVANPDGTVKITINNAAVPQTITLSLGSIGGYDGITQFDDDFTPQTFDVDGSEATTLASTDFDEDGTIWGVYENGDRRALYKIPVATVTNPDGLRAQNGNAYSVSRDSGDMVLNLAGNGSAGGIKNYLLEQSNVDIAQELTDMIQVQRAYSSNAKVIMTEDEMLQETTNIKR